MTGLREHPKPKMIPVALRDVVANASPSATSQTQDGRSNKSGTKNLTVVQNKINWMTNELVNSIQTSIAAIISIFLYLNFV